LEALGNRADIQASRFDGNTALHFAVRHDNIQMAKQLLLHGADINAQNCNGNTPLHIASMYGKKAMIIFLLSHDADPAI